MIHWVIVGLVATQFLTAEAMVWALRTRCAGCKCSADRKAGWRRPLLVF